MDFGFFDVLETDYHGMRALLAPGSGNELLPSGATFDVSGLAGVLCEQAAVGSVVKQIAEGSEEPTEDGVVLGFMSAISLHAHRTTPFAKDLIASLTQRCPEASAKASLQELLGAESSGLLVSARMLNLPPALVPSLLDALLKDIVWAGKHSDEATERASFSKMTKLIVVANVELAADTGAASSSTAGASSAEGGGKKKQKRAMAEAALLESLTFARAEEEVLAAAAEWSTLLNGPGRSRQLLMALTPAAIKQAIPALHAVMGTE